MAFSIDWYTADPIARLITAFLGRSADTVLPSLRQYIELISNLLRYYMIFIVASH
jgi:hypothetical protein